MRYILQFSNNPLIMELHGPAYNGTEIVKQTFDMVVEWGEMIFHNDEGYCFTIIPETLTNKNDDLIVFSDAFVYVFTPISGI